MKILKLHLENFQGLKDFSLVPNGGDASVYGDNGVGKSTLYNAFTWLMYGKASTDEKNYTPKTVGSHHLDHIVELTAELDDGSQLTLKKDYHEVYKTKRGNADPVFAGHTSDYYIDGVPTNETDFNARLKDIYKTEELARMLTSYSYFLEDMKIKDRRDKLLEICGDVDFDSVIKSDENLIEFPTILKKPGETDSFYTVEEYQAIASKEKKLIDKKLKEIPERIDEALKARPDTEGLNKRDLEAKLEELKQTKADAVASNTKDNAIAKAQEELANARADYSFAAAKYLETESKKTEGVRGEIRQLQEKAGKIQEETDRLSRELRRTLEIIKDMTAERSKLIAEWNEENAKQWTGSGICPTCGQILPPAYLERVQSEFNTRKSKKLEDISNRGKAVSKAVIAAAEEASKKIDASLSVKMGELNAIEAEIEKAKAGMKESAPFIETEEGQKLATHITDLENRLGLIKEAEFKAPNADLLENIEGMIEGVRTKLANVEMAEKQDARKAELEEEEKELSAQFESLTHGLYLCDLYSKAKAALLDDKVNSHFETLKFRLFIEQQNGGIADDCEALIPCGDTLVPFRSANNAARINAGLEIIDALSNYYGVQLPIYVDNAESSTKIRDTKAQQIRLYVSENDKTLRVEV